MPADAEVGGAPRLTCVAGPALAVAAKATLSAPNVACACCAPAIVPIVQLPALARPRASVVTLGACTVPLPLATMNRTDAPGMNAAPASRTSIVGGSGSVEPTLPDCASPLTFTSAAGTCTTAVGRILMTVSTLTRNEAAERRFARIAPPLPTPSAAVSRLSHNSAGFAMIESRVSRTVAAMLVSRSSEVSVSVATRNVTDFATRRTFTSRRAVRPA